MITLFAVNLFVIGSAVMIHYEFLYRITPLLPVIKIRHRFRIVPGVFVALTGPVLITWSASFLYLEMTRYWDGD